MQDLFDAGTLVGLDDAQLLGRFLDGRGAAGDRAFEVLVGRHGPMVFRVCRGSLRDGHAAHDAFQATFLVLARRAGSIRRREALASWLHGVALRVSHRARRAADRRRLAESRAATLRVEAAPAAPDAGDFEAIHREVDRLPRRYREAVVLCDLDGLTYETAARLLGCPLGTLAARVHRGRERLRVALTRRGLGDAGLLPLAGLPARSLPAGLVAATARVAVRGATRSAAGGVPAAVEALAGRTAMLMRFELIGIGALGLVAGVLGLGAVALAASGAATPPPQSEAPPPAARPAPANAATVVRAIREQDAWLERVASLRVEAESSQERTPAMLARMRRARLERNPRANLDADVNLLPRRTARAELAFDRNRVRTRLLVPPGVERIAAFDGRRVVAGTIEAGPDVRTRIRIARNPGRVFGSVLSWIPSLVVLPHRFWWASDPRDQLTPVIPEPEDYVAAGRDRFDDTECNVFGEWETQQLLYVAEGRLRGVKLGWKERPDLAGRCAAVLRRAGFVVRNDQDYLQGLDGRERREAIRTLAAHMLELIEPYGEFGMQDYREVALGRWIPFRQVIKSFSLDDEGRNTLQMTNTIRVVAVEVDRPLPDDLFAVAIPEGATVRDETADPPTTYEHKANFTPAERNAIVSQGREQAARDETYRREQAALIGRPAPEFPAGATWMQGPPVRWADLAGRVVVLDFWAEWCGPCREDLPALARIHLDRAANGLTVLGVHPPGSEPAAIEKVMRDFQMEYPTCVAVAPPGRPDSWGAMFERYGVRGIPHAVVVDREGRIAATGTVGEVLRKARELARPAKSDPGG